MSFHGVRTMSLSVIIARNPEEIRVRGQLQLVKCWGSTSSVFMPRFGMIEEVLLWNGGRGGVFRRITIFTETCNFWHKSWQSFLVFWVNRVSLRTSSVKDCLYNTAIIAFLQLRIRRFRLLQKVEPQEGWISTFELKISAISDGFHAFIHSLLSSGAPTQFDPLLLKIVAGLPFSSINRVIEVRQLFATKDGKLLVQCSSRQTGEETTPSLHSLRLKLHFEWTKIFNSSVGKGNHSFLYSRLRYISH